MLRTGVEVGEPGAGTGPDSNFPRTRTAALSLSSSLFLSLKVAVLEAIKSFFRFFFFATKRTHVPCLKEKRTSKRNLSATKLLQT
jgi:hypothetical protein